jgi:hypothetical protein
MIDGGLLQDSACVILDVLSAMHFIAVPWRLISLTAVKRCFAHYGFPVDHVSSTDNVALKFTEIEKKTGIVCNLLECGLRTTQYVRGLPRFV